ncbi:tetratricopeptide repeat-containing sensor histidine kinase [Foetidibacter luteolus]|uniref:tetratricopeptide repeat-containing sensor histidine kinase n=1 Tax=Foetidibacter luteolus TaxID=2608880 RepID=UPI001A980942|nr:tetratricopeptide repeat-containing sensor histidine kinase [Foetidibacter luteolus]
MSCGNRSDQAYHPSFFDSVYNRLPGPGDTSVRPGDLELLDAAYSAFPNMGTGDLYRKYRYKFLYFFEVLGDEKRGLVFTDSIINLLAGKEENPDFVRLYVNALFNKGDILAQGKRYQESALYYMQGHKVALEKLTDPCSLVEYNARMGRLLYKQGNYERAIASFQAGLLDQSLCDTNSFFKFKATQEYLDNIGMCYNALSNYDSANHYYSATLAYINRQETFFSREGRYIAMAKAVVYDNQARIFQKQGRADEAQALYKKSIAGTSGYHRLYTQLTQLALTRLYLENNRLERAVALLDNLKASIDSFPSEQSLIGYFACMKNYYERRGKLSVAAMYMKEYLELKDSVQNLNTQAAGNDIINSFNTKAQNALYRKLKDDGRVKSVYLIVIVLLALLSVYLLILVKRRYARSRIFLQETEALYEKIDEKNHSLQSVFHALDQKNNEHISIMNVTSNDLKIPLSVIYETIGRLPVEVLRDDDLQESLLLIREASASSLHIIEEMHPFKIDQQVNRKELVDLKAFLEQSINLLEPGALQKKQRIELNLKQAFAFIDRQKLRRVINNIVINAIKFSNENSVISIHLEKKETSSLISIRDYGIGIPAVVKEQIFKHKKVEGLAGTAGEESFGMGLSIAKKFIEENNGKIWFDSKEGWGTVFHIELAM